MQILKYMAVGLLGLAVFVVLIFAIKTRKPLKTLLLNALSGIVVFAVIELTKKYTGVHIPLNEYTATAMTVFGIPGVSGILLLKVIFGV